jgi:hypothetical protein
MPKLKVGTIGLRAGHPRQWEGSALVETCGVCDTDEAMAQKGRGEPRVRPPSSRRAPRPGRTQGSPLRIRSLAQSWPQ